MPLESSFAKDDWSDDHQTMWWSIWKGWMECWYVLGSCYDRISRGFVPCNIVRCLWRQGLHHDAHACHQARQAVPICHRKCGSRASRDGGFRADFAREIEGHLIEMVQGGFTGKFARKRKGKSVLVERPKDGIPENVYDRAAKHLQPTGLPILV